MRIRGAAAAVVALLSLLIHVQARSGPQDESFAFLEPTIQFSDEERQQLDNREIALRILPANGHELAALAAGALAVGPDDFLASARNVVSLKRSSFVPQIGRFSTPPRIEDLQALTLDDGDIDEIRHCSPGRCDLKLSADEIAAVKPLACVEGPNGRAALDRAFRRLLVERARRYLTNGEEYAPREFVSLLYSGPYVRARFSPIATYLERYPRSPRSGAESFLYWSKETYAWKPMISITHVTLLRGDRQNGAPEATVVSRDIYATRYTSGSFVLTMVFRDVDTPGRHYLVYINRTWVDAMRGLWRPFVEHRVRAQARKVFAATRDRIEQNGIAVSAVR